MSSDTICHVWVSQARACGTCRLPELSRGMLCCMDQPDEYRGMQLMLRFRPVADQRCHQGRRGQGGPVG